MSGGRHLQKMKAGCRPESGPRVFRMPFCRGGRFCWTKKMASVAFGKYEINFYVMVAVCGNILIIKNTIIVAYGNSIKYNKILVDVISIH